MPVYKKNKSKLIFYDKLTIVKVNLKILKNVKEIDKTQFFSPISSNLQFHFSILFNSLFSFLIILKERKSIINLFLITFSEYFTDNYHQNCVTP